MNGKRVVFRIVWDINWEICCHSHNDANTQRLPIWSHSHSLTWAALHPTRMVIIIWWLTMLSKRSKFTRPSVCSMPKHWNDMVSMRISVYMQSSHPSHEYVKENTYGIRAVKCISILSIRKLLLTLLGPRPIHLQQEERNKRTCHSRVFCVYHFVSFRSHFGRCQILKTKHQYLRSAWGWAAHTENTNATMEQDKERASERTCVKEKLFRFTIQLKRS